MGNALIVAEIPDPKLNGAILAFVDKSQGRVDRSFSAFIGQLFGKPRGTREARKTVEPWIKNTSSDIVIDVFNLASIDLFLNHVAQLDGLADSAEALEKCRWRNLPYYIHSVWLPLSPALDDPDVVNVSGWPFQIGSISGLLKDLDEIAAESDKSFGAKPYLFDLMLNSPKDFYEATTDGFTPDATLQWIWFAYKFGAELAVEKNMTLWQAG